MKCANHIEIAAAEYRAELARIAEVELVPFEDGRAICVLTFVGASGLFISFELNPAA